MKVPSYNWWQSAWSLLKKKQCLPRVYSICHVSKNDIHHTIIQRKYHAPFKGQKKRIAMRVFSQDSAFISSFFPHLPFVFYFLFFFWLRTRNSIRGFVRPSVRRSVVPLVREHESKSVKTRISAPAHPQLVDVYPALFLSFFFPFWAGAPGPMTHDST